MAGNTYGLDLGTYEIKVYDKKKDQIWKEKSVIAIKNRKQVLATGDEAYAMFEKAPGCIEVAFPMQNGVIARFHDMQNLLVDLLKKGRQFSGGDEYVIAVPTDVTEVEKRAFYDLVYHSSASAKSVMAIERGLADAIGLGLDVFQTSGLMIVNFGGSSIELSVLAYGGIVLNRRLKFGGAHLDQAILEKVRHNHDFLIGRLTAEKLRREFGVFSEDSTATMQIAGKNLLLGLPQRTDISVGLVRAVMKNPMDDCVEAIKAMIERTPPDIRRGILKNGIYLTGGLSNLKGLADYLRERIGLQVFTTAEPELCSISGLMQIIQNRADYKGLTYSMMGESYRWLK